MSDACSEPLKGQAHTGTNKGSKELHIVCYNLNIFISRKWIVEHQPQALLHVGPRDDDTHQHSRLGLGGLQSKEDACRASDHTRSQPAPGSPSDAKEWARDRCLRLGERNLKAVKAVAD